MTSKNMKTKQSSKMSKKELKDFVNSNGFFTSALIDREINAPGDLSKKIPEGAMYFEAIASNGELNRNGYIIRESAWKSAIAGYMKNPVILLQHDMDQPIGRVLRAEVNESGLVIRGYVFDELTGGRFSKGLFNAVSTGHITEGLEFENKKTKETLTEEQFRALPWEQKDEETWLMAVLKLDWLENSIVSIGANRKSLVLARDLVKNYIDSIKNEVEEEDTDEEVEEETEEVPAVSEEETTEEAPKESVQEAEIVEGETPLADADPAETNAVPESEQNSILNSEDKERKMNKVVKDLVSELNLERAKVAHLKAQLDLTPNPKGVVISHQSAVNQAPKIGAIGQAFQNSGIK